MEDIQQFRKSNRQNNNVRSSNKFKAGSVAKPLSRGNNTSTSESKVRGLGKN